MKLQFNQTVQDKNTGEYYKPNTTYEFDDARAKEILSTGYAVVIEELKGTKPIEVCSGCEKLPSANSIFYNWRLKVRLKVAITI